jgi:hypothetical protein
MDEEYEKEESFAMSKGNKPCSLYYKKLLNHQKSKKNLTFLTIDKPRPELLMPTLFSWLYKAKGLKTLLRS